MRFKNAELFNICEMLPAADGRGGYDLFRLPKEAREGANDGVKKNGSHYCCGAEIRFVINSGKARVTVRTAAADPAGVPGKSSELITYYGGIQAGWQTAAYRYTDQPTVLEIAPPPSIEMLEKLTLLNGYPYSPKVVRLLLPNRPVVLVDIEGDIRPPEEDEVPLLRGLMYGSSITHGSLALIANNYLPEAVGRRLRAEICNLGFAGSCQAEESITDYIASRTDCDFFFSELGINMLSKFEAEEFESRVRHYINTAAAALAGKYFFVTDIYYCSEDLRGTEKVKKFREIVRRVCEETECANVHYICGLELLGSSAGLSADLTHPNVDGMHEIAENIGARLSEIMGLA